MYKLYANTIPFFIRGLENPQIQREVLEPREIEG